MRLRAMAVIVASVLLSFCFSTKNAYAYLDPGTGSYIFQLVMAAIIGGLFVLKLFWAKITRPFKKMFQIKKK